MKSIYEEITDKLIAMMEKGIIPWTKPWVCGGGIVSYATGKPYSLLNRMLLDRPGAYVTFHQVQEAGGRIRKGAKARKIYFYKPTVIETSEEIENRYKSKALRHPQKLQYFSFFRYGRARAPLDGQRSSWQRKQARRKSRKNRSGLS